MNTEAQALATTFAAPLQELLNACKASGLRVYVRPTERPRNTYAFITDGKGIAYVQEEYFGPPKISTMHKPCRECGTGFGLDIPATVDNVRAAMEMVAPKWATPSDRRAVRKWESWEEYANSNHGNWSDLIEY